MKLKPLRFHESFFPLLSMGTKTITIRPHCNPFPYELFSEFVFDGLKYCVRIIAIKRMKLHEIPLSFLLDDGIRQSRFVSNPCYTYPPRFSITIGLSELQCKDLRNLFKQVWNHFYGDTPDEYDQNPDVDVLKIKTFPMERESMAKKKEKDGEEVTVTTQPDPQPDPQPKTDSAPVEPVAQELAEQTMQAPDTEKQDLQNEIQVLREALDSALVEVDFFRNRKKKEEQLISRRNSCLYGIEEAKNSLASKKKALAEVEEEIAALLQQDTKPWSETPIGKDVSKAKEEATAPAPEKAPEKAPEAPEWQSVLPPVDPSAVRVINDTKEGELPNLDAILNGLITDQEMQGEKRSTKKAITCYGSLWLVTQVWSGQDGSVRANVVGLFTKDEWNQIFTEEYGRPVDDFDQSPEAKDQRQKGGKWCGLVVKVGKKVYVVGPQKSAMQLVHESLDVDVDGVVIAPTPSEFASAEELPKECPSCGKSDWVEGSECPTCSRKRCEACDPGSDVACPDCEDQANRDNQSGAGEENQ
jgi:hypothetical protein